MITKTVVLRCPPERAFALFTEEAGRWWPDARRHTDDASSDIRIEASGRFFERARGGTEVELGRVRTFVPPGRLVLDWFPGTGPASPTHVDVRFEPVTAGTLSTIVHGPGPGDAEPFERNAAAYGRSWDLVLAAIAQHLTMS